MQEALNELLKKVQIFFGNYGFNLLSAVIILIIGYFLIKGLCALVLRIIYTTKIDNAVGGFCVAILKFVLWILLFFIIASLLGISGNEFLVAFSSIALAIGLSLKDSLSNIANGVIIIMTKPFSKGDHILVNGIEGKIKSIKILTTEIVTFDNKKIVLPNSSIVNNPVINYTANPTRRLDMTFCVSYDADIKVVKTTLYEIIRSNEKFLSTPAPVVMFKTQNASSLDFDVRVWVNTEDYFFCISLLNELVFEAFKSKGIEIPFNQLDLHIREPLKISGDKHEKNI